MKKLDSGFNWINLDQFERCWHKHTMTGKNGNWKTSRIICGDMSRETATRWRGPETWQQWSRKISREGVKLLLGNSNQGKHEGKRTAGKCVYCGNEHRSSSCTNVLSVDDRREILKKNKRCYNCTGMGHSAANSARKFCLQYLKNRMKRTTVSQIAVRRQFMPLSTQNWTDKRFVLWSTQEFRPSNEIVT